MATAAGVLDFGDQDAGYVGHLQAQISFLHTEVERLEDQLSSIREKVLLEAKDNQKHLEQAIEQKNAELQQWRTKSLQRKPDIDYAKRCAALEKQLSVAHSEKNILTIEKNELAAKSRKLESALKSKKAEQSETYRISLEETSAVEGQLIKLSQALTTVTEERDALKADLKKCTKSKIHVDAETQIISLELHDSSCQTTIVSTRDQSCQVESVIHFSEPSSQAMHNLCQALEQKTQESDSFRGKLDDLQEIQEETLRLLDTTKKRLVEEVERRKLISDDAEKLSIQVKSLQQKCSAQAATERDLVGKIDHIENQRQQLRVELSRLERDRNSWENQIRQYEKDMEQLALNKNYSNQQLSLLANENENLRAEVQRLLTRESQLAFTLKAKDGELQEVLQAYQNSAAESETIMENQRFLERELDNVRATLASKEEAIIYLQEQLSGLHQREQQLVLDIQTFEYENEQLHRRIVSHDAHIGQLESKCQELQQVIHAKDHSIEEIHQSLAELSKQVVIKENEVLLLRRRCDSLEANIAHLETVASNESQKNRSLEEANARLVARDVLSSGASYDYIARELEDANKKLSLCKSEQITVSEKLADEIEQRKKAEGSLVECQAKLKVALESKERFEKIVLDQTKAFSSLAK